MNSFDSSGRGRGNVVRAGAPLAAAGGAPGAAAGRGGEARRRRPLGLYVLALAAAFAAAPACGTAGAAGEGDGSSDESPLRGGDDDDDDDDEDDDDGTGPGGSGNLTSAEARLLVTLNKLASYGEKRAGTAKGRQAGDYVKGRFQDAGLREVKFEEFTVNGFDVASSSLTLTATTPEGQTQPLALAGHQVFAYSGADTFADVEVVDVGEGRPANYAAPVAGKVVLVRASQTFHRSSQLRVAIENGAVGMISASSAPSNFVQVGGVSAAELGLGPAPALSIGGADGAAVRAAIAAGQTVRASLSVSATVAPRKGRNVVGRLKRSNSRPTDPYVLVGAHYDTWAAGATDNGTGVAALLEIAETLNDGPRQYDVVFVGYDAEELGLFGGYDYLRRHVVRDRDTIASFVNLEMIGRAKPSLQGDLLARFFVFSKGGPLERVTGEADMASIYPNVLGLENVAPLSGGLIPTDVQGLYWLGVDGTIAFGASPFYHTAADTPDTVDLPFLATNTALLRGLVDEIDQEPAASFRPNDPTLMYPEVRLDRSNPAFTRVDVTVRDANGEPVPNPWARVQVYVDDFITPQQAGVPANHAAVQEVIGDENGKVTFDVAASLVNAGSKSRWIHVRAGNASERFPRGESVTEVL